MGRGTRTRQCRALTGANRRTARRDNLLRGHDLPWLDQIQPGRRQIQLVSRPLRVGGKVKSDVKMFVITYN